MVFTTFTFVLFYALVFAGYWALDDRRAQNVLLLIASYVFYSWWDWRFSGLMLAASLLDYVVGRGLERTEGRVARRLWLSASLAGNLGMLGFFKYYGFFAENLRTAAATIGVTLDRPTLEIVLPVGISFYTFQTLSYAIDIYRRELRGDAGLVDYLCFVSFFPQLVAGPIERATHLLPQFESRREFDPSAAADGCRLMLWGAFKKMVVADNLAPVVEGAFARPGEFSGAELAAACVAFGIQIYCDFSGYSDIARGSASLLGFRLMNNFQTPYFSSSVAEFWRRWHVSLSTWFRDYVYVPLGGSRVPTWRRSANLLATFAISGFWHGASWNFVLWGLYHGLAVLPSHFHRRSSSPRSALLHGGAVVTTFVLVTLGWPLFRSRDMPTAMAMLGRMATSVGDAGWIATFLGFFFHSAVGGAVFVAIVVLFLAEFFQGRRTHPFDLSALPRPVGYALESAMLWSIVVLGTIGGTDFIYFQF